MSLPTFNYILYITLLLLQIIINADISPIKDMYVCIFRLTQCIIVVAPMSSLMALWSSAALITSIILSYLPHHQHPHPRDHCFVSGVCGNPPEHGIAVVRGGCHSASLCEPAHGNGCEPEDEE